MVKVPSKRLPPPEENDLSSDDDDYREEEEEDDVEIDEEDEDVGQNKKKKSKKRRNPFNNFIDDEAEVDEDDEEEELYDEADDLINENEVEEIDNNGPNARALDSRRRMQEFMAQDEEEIERYYAQRYQDQTHGDRFGQGELMADSIIQQSQLPEIKDPNLWVIKCRMGEEKSTVLALMRKFIAMQTTDNPLRIKSAFAKEGLKGYIYIEAFRQNHVKEAIDGINALGMARYKQTLVPINEMTDVLKVVKESRSLKNGQWVRIKSGIFKDDLAIVDFVEDAQNLVGLKLLPRIDYEKINRFQVGKNDNDGKRGRFKRPPSALLDIKKVKDSCQSDGSYIIYAGNRYDNDGYLRKNFRINAISSEGITPTLTELERFGQTLDNSQLAVAASMVSGGATTGNSNNTLLTHQFVPGDIVIVSQGDLKDLKGKIISVDGDSRIIVQPNHTDLKEPIPFTPLELQKYFLQGDHVKILSGPHEGETGLVIRFDPNVAIVLSDQNMSELKVMPKHLRLWQDHAVNVNTPTHVQMLDLVQVDAQTVGVVVASERDKISILTILGKLIDVKANTSLRKLNAGPGKKRAAQSLDKNSNLIQAKDSVSFVEKPYCGMTGEVKHIYRSWAFVYSKTHMKNAGIIVVKSKHISLVGAPSSVSNIKQIPNAQNKRDNAPQSRSKLAEKKLFGKTARIIAGTLKGLTGIIFEATPREVYLELHSQFRKVHVLRENIALVDSSGRILPSQLGTLTTPRPTSMHEPQTPLHGSQTPHASSMTPRPDATPLSNYFMASMATPAVRSGEDIQTPNSNFNWQAPSDYKMGLSLSDNE